MQQLLNQYFGGLLTKEVDWYVDIAAICVLRINSGNIYWKIFAQLINDII